MTRLTARTAPRTAPRATSPVTPYALLRRAGVVGALTACLGLTACGEDGSGSAVDPSAEETSSTETPSETPETTSESPTDTPSEEPAGPACVEVWVAGQTLPARYAGCQDAEKDKWIQAMVYRCSSGQRLVTYQRNFYAAMGEVIIESPIPLARNPEFEKVLASCGA